MNPVTWIVIALLVAISALYVAAEFATVSVRNNRIRQQAEEGNALAARLLPILNDPQRLDRYIAACQVGITLASLGLGAYGQATLAREITPLIQRLGGLQDAAARSVSAFTVLIGLTLLLMILGELVPKSLALQFPSRMALATVLPMRWSELVLAPFIWVLNGSGLAILKWIGVEHTGHRHIHSPQEIELLIAESRDGGLLEPDEHRRLRRALQLSVRPVRQLMIPRPRIAAVSVDISFDELLRQVRESPYTRLPVYRGDMDHVLGMVHTKDVVRAAMEPGRAPSVEDLVRPMLTVHESITADRLLALLRERRSHQALVADEYGGIAGLVTVEDVLRELMGDVVDEFKDGQPRPERLPDGRVRLPGRMRLDDAEPWLGARWDGEADTVAGHVAEVLGAIPSAGQRATIDGVEVEVERVANHTVQSVIALPATTGESARD